jgi:hypothetical protein
MKEANDRTDDDIAAILEFLLHFPVRFISFIKKKKFLFLFK